MRAPQSAPSVAGWSSLAARRAHNPKVVGSNPTPATNPFGGGDRGPAEGSRTPRTGHACAGEEGMITRMGLGAHFSFLRVGKRAILNRSGGDQCCETS